MNAPTGDVIINSMTVGAVGTNEISYFQNGKALTIAGGISSQGGNITIDPEDVSINADIDGAGGNVVVEADNNITFNAGDVITTGTGNIRITADQDMSGAGDLVIATAGTSGDEKIRTGSGTIDLSGENITLKNFSAVTTGTANLTAGMAPSSTGQIDGSAAADGNVDISAGTLNLTANGAGIGTANAVEFNAATAINALADGNILLTNQSGDFKIGSISANSGAANVTLVSQANITDAAGDFEADVTANTLTVTATNGINIDTDIASFGVTAALGGDIALDETDAITLNAATTSNGGAYAITVTAGDAITATDVTSAGGRNRYADGVHR